jgi:erythronate-4-phosphate dehydrogenase
MILVVDTKLQFARPAFERLGDVRWLETRKITHEGVLGADALLIRSETHVGRELLAGTKVRFVGTATIGTDHLDLPYLKAKGIGFASAPGSNANSVAEYIVGALLELAARRSWSLARKSIGIVGVGNVGSKVVRYVNALGMEILLNDPPLADATHDPRYVPLDSLMGADIVSLHVPLTRDGLYPTYHFFGSSRIRRLKEGGVLINTSRGAVVETGALKESLGTGHLGGAVLDVWEGEPGIDIDLLEAVDLGTSHIAGYSYDGKLNAARTLFGAVAQHFGIDAVWHPLDDSPPPASPEIVVPESLQGEDILRFVVRQCYDIRKDDAGLRKTIGTPPADREAAFRSLRANYGDRREFSSTTVHLSAHRHEAAWVLTTLGFQVK